MYQLGVLGFHYDAAVIAVAVILLSCVVRAIYLLVFHPLARIPGPKLAALSSGWFLLHVFTGNIAFVIADTHRKYGPVIRIGPNQVVFSSLQAMQDLYGPRSNQGFVKSDFYDILAVDAKTRGLVAETDPEKHARERELFAHKFSSEAIPKHIFKESIDTFLELLHGKEATDTAGVELNNLYSCLTFDVMGVFIFGKGFDTLKNGQTHEWIELIPDGFRWGTKFWALNAYFGSLVAKIFTKIFAPHMIKARAKAREYTREKMAQGGSCGTSEYNDNFINFCDQASSKADHPKLSEREITAHGATLVIAGTETTASALASTTFFLAKNHPAYAQLQDEIRHTFQSSDEITCASTANLPYLKAVINESLRLFPPVSLGSKRTSPGGVVDGVYVPPGTAVSAATYAMARSPEFFSRPEEFLPERWLDRKAFQDRRLASQPFLIGPRNCVGRNVALMQIRLLLAKMFFEFDFELVQPDLEWNSNCGSFSVWPVKPDLYVRFRERKGSGFI